MRGRILEYKYFWIVEVMLELKLMGTNILGQNFDFSYYCMY